MFGIHVRVGPWFWIVSILIGWQICTRNGQIQYADLAAWVVCMFVADLFHELGHVIMGRIFGQKGNIMLYGLGGQPVGNYHLCRPWQQMLIWLAGPAAGLLLFGVVWLLIQPNYTFECIGLPDVRGPQLINKLDPAQFQKWLWRGANYLLVLTFLINVVNLVPVIPMDGGQVVRAACRGDTSPNGLRLALVISIVVAGFIVGYSLMARGDPEMWYPGVPNWATFQMVGFGMDPMFEIILYSVLGVQCIFMLFWVKSAQPAATEEDEPRRDW
jgi:Zn-dependent protease